MAVAQAPRMSPMAPFRGLSIPILAIPPVQSAAKQATRVAAWGRLETTASHDASNATVACGVRVTIARGRRALPRRTSTRLPYQYELRQSGQSCAVNHGMQR